MLHEGFPAALRFSDEIFLFFLSNCKPAYINSSSPLDVFVLMSYYDNELGFFSCGSTLSLLKPD